MHEHNKTGHLSHENNEDLFKKQNILTTLKLAPAILRTEITILSFHWATKTYIKFNIRETQRASQ